MITFVNRADTPFLKWEILRAHWGLWWLSWKYLHFFSLKRKFKNSFQISGVLSKNYFPTKITLLTRIAVSLLLMTNSLLLITSCSCSIPPPCVLLWLHSPGMPLLTPVSLQFSPVIFPVSSRSCLRRFNWGLSTFWDMPVSLFDGNWDQQIVVITLLLICYEYRAGSCFDKSDWRQQQHSLSVLIGASWEISPHLCWSFWFGGLSYSSLAGAELSLPIQYWGEIRCADFLDACDTILPRRGGVRVETQPPGSGGCSRALPCLPQGRFGAVQVSPPCVGPNVPSQRKSECLQLSGSANPLEISSIQNHFTTSKGNKTRDLWLGSDGRQTLAKHPGPAGEMIACSFQTQHLIPVLWSCPCSDCEQKRETSHFTLSKILPRRGFSAAFCFANAVNECVNTCWHGFPSLPRLEFRLLTRLAVRGAPFVNLVHPLIRGSFAGQRCAQALLLGWLLYYYCNCKCHMWGSWGVCLEGWLYN